MNSQFELEIEKERSQTKNLVPHLIAKNFSFYYGNHEAVKQLNATFYQQQVTAIIGPSGCGKSTYLRSINRMNDLIPNTHTSGQLLFGEQDVYDPRIDMVLLRRKIGMVFQKPNPFAKSIYDNIAYGPKLYASWAKKELDELVEKSLRQAALWDEVKDRLDKSAIGLSGGQQQRLCIARALAVSPDILLMDEPTSALDPRSTIYIENLINELKNHYTIVIVTHNMQQAARISDFTAFMYEGSLIEYDRTSKMFTRPTQKATEDYISGRFG